MHFKSLLHVRDHAKVRGRAFALLQDIASHTNMHTGEAFELSVDRLAARHEVTPQWTRRLLNLLIASGELIVQRSRGRHPNVYIIPYERCPACQGDNPKLEYRDDFNPKLVPPQPETERPPTRNSTPLNPKLDEGSTARLAGIGSRKDLKDLKERKEGATRNSEARGMDKPEMQNPFWCDAHGFAHGERQPDHQPDCVLER
jgi:hypothetical protein